MGTPIANLVSIGWKADEPDHWVDHLGGEWESKGKSKHPDFTQVEAQIQQGCNKHLDKIASNHGYGQGIEEGVDLVVLKKHISKLNKDRDYAAKGMLVATAAAGLWPPARVHQADPEASAACELCGHPWADEEHLAWGCAGICGHADPRISKSNFLVTAALKDLKNKRNTAFWIRGLIPTDWFPKGRQFVVT